MTYDCSGCEVMGICCILLSVWIELPSSRVMLVEELTHPRTLTCSLCYVRS